MAVAALGVACANMATLLLARSIEWRHELAIRLALGAARFDLVRRLGAEVVLLVVAGGLGAAALVVWLSALVPQTDGGLPTGPRPGPSRVRLRIGRRRDDRMRVRDPSGVAGPARPAQLPDAVTHTQQRSVDRDGRACVCAGRALAGPRHGVRSLVAQCLEHAADRPGLSRTPRGQHARRVPTGLEGRARCRDHVARTGP